MASAKDQCFKEAIETYEEATKKDLGIKHQLPWSQDLDGTWVAEETKIWWNVINSMLKTLGILSGTTPPREPGRPNPIQVRQPDVTVPTPNGKPVVVDNKFTDKNGKPDPWRENPGKGNKNTQRQDYNDINKRQGHEETDDWSLDKNKCKCGDGEPQPQEVWEPVTSPAYSPEGKLFFMPVPAPGALPVPLPAPVPAFPPGLVPVFP